MVLPYRIMPPFDYAQDGIMFGARIINSLSGEPLR